MGKEKNTIIVEKYFLKATIYLEKDMDLEKNIMRMVNYYLKVNLKEINNGLEKGMILKKIKLLMK